MFEQRLSSSIFITSLLLFANINTLYRRTYSRQFNEQTHTIRTTIPLPMDVKQENPTSPQKKASPTKRKAGDAGLDAREGEKYQKKVGS